jgi:hypothetical protein
LTSNGFKEWTMKKCFPLMLAVTALAASCEIQGARPGWLPAGCGSALGISFKPAPSQVQAEAVRLIGPSDSTGGVDGALLECADGARIAAGYMPGTPDSKPVISIFRQAGGNHEKEIDVALQGSGAPSFSERAMAPLAGVRDMNGNGSPEIVARTPGDCGEGSTYLNVITRDGREKWTRVFSSCEGETGQKRTAAESEFAENGTEVIKFRTFELENGAFVPKSTDALVWDGTAWRTYRTMEFKVDGPLQLKHRPR